MQPQDVRACVQMATDATVGMIGMVEAVHQAIGRLADPLGLTSRFSRLIYGAVGATAAQIGSGVHALVVAVMPTGEAAPSSSRREAAIAILNGVLGDYLAETRNPLAIEMGFRIDGRPLALETQALADQLPVTPKILLCVHGLCSNDRQWVRDGHDHGAALAATLGFTPVYLHYNTGLHISANGRRLSELIELLTARWPVPVEELAIVAHSMGGLVARSACYYGSETACRWPDYLRKAVFLGTPHHGTLLERAGNWVDAVLESNPFTAPLARLGRIRSAGITDLRFGNTRECDWEGRDRFCRSGDCRQPMPLPSGVKCFAIAAGVHPVLRSRLGDGLVPLESALGDHPDPQLALGFPPSHRWIAHGAGHLGLLRQREVYERIASWLAS